jgi:hypothetical protein
MGADDPGPLVPAKGGSVIPNVTRGAKTVGVLRYLVGKGKREEHEHPHLVAGSPEAVRIVCERELSGADAGALARFLDEPREQFGTSVTIAERDQRGRVVRTRDAHVWHCSLALHPDELVGPTRLFDRKLALGGEL